MYLGGIKWLSITRDPRRPVLDLVANVDAGKSNGATAVTPHLAPVGLSVKTLNVVTRSTLGIVHSEILRKSSPRYGTPTNPPSKSD